ncbi:DUF3995 domain-containing protein [Bosea sp. BK604]|uniref:DUF3995 domain-containing protein n=1 Tax=Bosea sp. BK604 TaxID=2512180 RepID=UPI00104E15AC|nr:DUF3995 domain-containing protein [Bosea sp. BK604]TCR64877.1 uncharacterized protein DUF3995 [Bosea sp. BK604]
MTAAVAAALASVLAAIALLHAYWGLGGLWPAADEQALVRTVIGDPRRKRMPPPRLCWLVAGALLLTAAWPLLLARLSGDLLPHWLVAGIGLAMMAVFLLRGLAGFLPAWRVRHTLEPFSTFDRRYYSPLCLVIAAGFAFVLLKGN